MRLVNVDYRFVRILTFRHKKEDQARARVLYWFTQTYGTLLQLQLHSNEHVSMFHMKRNWVHGITEKE